MTNTNIDIHSLEIQLLALRKQVLDPLSRAATGLSFAELLPLLLSGKDLNHFQKGE